MLLVLKQLSPKTRGLCVIVGVLLLAGCGSGSSNSGGSVDLAAAKLLGKQSIVLSSSNSVVNAEGSLKMSINPANQTVTIEDTSFEAISAISDEVFSASSPQLNIVAGSRNLSCTGFVSYTGSANPLAANGVLSGELRCNGEKFTVSGEFFAEPVSSKIIPVGTSFSEAVQNVL